MEARRLLSECGGAPGEGGALWPVRMGAVGCWRWLQAAAVAGRRPANTARLSLCPCVLHHPPPPLPTSFPFLWPPPLCATGIFGEYDRYFFPSIVDKAASGKLKYIIGSGTNRFDWTYAGNVAQAHEMACRTLAVGVVPGG